MNDIIEDIVKIYLSCTDSYSAKVHQTINDKYTIIDKSMIAAYLFVKIIEDRKEINNEVTDVLCNYLLRQNIYGETGSLAFEISDSQFQLYNEILDKLIIEKYKYKNRIMKKLKYNYKNIKKGKYDELISFLEIIAEYSMFKKLVLRGNKEAQIIVDKNTIKITEYINSINAEEDYFYSEKKNIVDLILNNSFETSQYGNLVYVVLNLKDVYRYSNSFCTIPENDLLHQYEMAIVNLAFAEYCNKDLDENLDIYSIVVKSMFHDFGEYKGTEVVTHFKNYNEVTKKMFAEIEEKDEKELEAKIGTNLYNIISAYKYGAEGFVCESIDKFLGIMKLLVEVKYNNNYTFIRLLHSIYQERFKRFLRVENIDEIKNKKFFMDFIREYYIYIKGNVMEANLEYFFKYFTEEELEEYRAEITNLKSNPDSFLR